MNPPIIISAFGTTSKAVATYNQLDAALREHFCQTEITWAYSSKKIGRERGKKEDFRAAPPAEVLNQLAARGITKVVVQSLHLFPGTEFHGLVQVAGRSPLECAIGMPLLTSPEDYDQLGEILQPSIAGQAGKAILILGHGTVHPIWTAYYSLEKILRKKFGKNIFVGVVEKYPDTNQLIDEIACQGFSQTRIIPLFLVAGMHYQRDIIGDKASSWRSRLEQKGIEVECLDYGLGLHPGLEQLIIRHIIEAGKTLS